MTGGTNVYRRLEYPNYSGALAIAGNLVFLGHYDGAFTTHEALTLEEGWTFNVGTSMNAPAIGFAVNRKKYIAVLVGSAMRQRPFAHAVERLQVELVGRLGGDESHRRGLSARP